MTPSETRRQLMRAGAELFAVHGVHATRTREIVRLAGQRNESALQYHFGSRLGLLEAIVEDHLRPIEAQRRAMLDALEAQDRLSDVAALVETICVPTANRLHTEDGRNYLRIVPQVISQLQLRGELALHSVAPSLPRTIELIRAALPLPPAIAIERTASVITLGSMALAERALQLSIDDSPAIDHDTYIANLVVMATAALTAPLPEPKTD